MPAWNDGPLDWLESSTFADIRCRLRVTRPLCGLPEFRDVYRAVRGTRYAPIQERMPVSTGKVQP